MKCSNCNKGTLARKTIEEIVEIEGGPTLKVKGIRVLQCAFLNEEGADTLVVQDAFAARVGTAYELGKDDAKARKEWLKTHPDYEEAPGAKVRRKISITRIGRKDK